MRKTTVTWRDIGLRERLTVLSSADGAPLTLAALQALSNATVTTAHTGDVQSSLTLPSDATYPDLDDCWVIVGEDNGGYRTQLYIPAPLVTQAIADGITYQPFTTEWINVANALAAVAVPYTQASIQTIVAASMARHAEMIYQTWLDFGGEQPWARRTIEWAGIHGGRRITHLVGLTDSLGGDFDAVQAAFTSVSAARPAVWWEGPMSVTYTDPATDQYNSVRDAAEFTFLDATGCESTVVLPAPLRSLFLSDGKTVDLTVPAVASLVAAAISELVIPVSGAAVTACAGGRLAKQAVQ